MTVRELSRLDAGLRDLALVAAAASTGCSPCGGSGYWGAAARARVLEEIRAVPHWGDGAVFTRLERLVMLYAEAMTMTPPVAASGLAADLGVLLGQAGLDELTAIIAAAGPAGRAGLD